MNSRNTRVKLIESLGRGLSDLDADHLRRHRRIADSARSARMSVDGRRIVGFASNDYLGFAAHPALIQALGDGARRYGASSGGPTCWAVIRARMRRPSKTWPRSVAALSTTLVHCIFAPATWRTWPY